MPQGIHERSDRLNRCRSSHVGRRSSAILADEVRVNMSRPAFDPRPHPQRSYRRAYEHSAACRAGGHHGTRRRGEVVKLACDVLEDEGMIERVGGRHHPKWRRPTGLTADRCMNTAFPPSSGWMAPGLDERLARELVQGLRTVRHLPEDVDPAARLLQFRDVAAGRDRDVARSYACRERRTARPSDRSNPAGAGSSEVVATLNNGGVFKPLLCRRDAWSFAIAMRLALRLLNFCKKIVSSIIAKRILKPAM